MENNLKKTTQVILEGMENFIRLSRTIDGQQVVVPNDSGRTHNFIQQSAAYRLGLGRQALSEFRVYIGSGDYLLCKEVCRQVAVSIQGPVIMQGMYVLIMEGENMVFGVQWLETLGNLLTNYKMLTLQFDQQGTPIKFQGDIQLVDVKVSKRRSRGWSPNINVDHESLCMEDKAILRLDMTWNQFFLLKKGRPYRLTISLVFLTVCGLNDCAMSLELLFHNG